MRVIVTGAGGFVGRQICRQLIAAGHDAVRLNRALTPEPASELIAGNLCDPAIVARAFAGGCDAVVHLATIPGGAAETDPQAARRTNVYASMLLTEAAARPMAPSGMKSAFMSDVFHALREGKPFVSPVSSEATIWLISVDAAAKAFVQALDLAGPLPPDRAITLPALRVRMDELAAEIARQCRARADLVAYEPDAALEAAFGALPPLNASRATELGFQHDGSTDRLVASALATIARTEGLK